LGRKKIILLIIISLER